MTLARPEQLITAPMGRSGPSAGRLRARDGFTLVEVILAIVIALGILVVLLYFYQQSTNLRAQAIQETERISAARLLMDRITGELRTSQGATSFGEGFIGSSNSIQFVKADVPSFAAWTGGTLGRAAFPVTDLKRIRYELQSGDGTNVNGLIRTEEPLVQRDRVSAPDELPGTNSVVNAAAPPVLEEIRYLQFRYWSGTNWLDSWSAGGLPEGVEVSLGSEPLTNATEVADYPGEIFRRVIYLAGMGSMRAAPGGNKTNAVDAPGLQEGTP